MEILDVNDYTFDGENRTYYDVSYKGKSYRKYQFYWTEIHEDGPAGSGSVTIDYQRHLNKVWDKTYGDKNISKKVEIIIN